ncbi:MAG: hypothetical protein GX638_15855 [Crenarchaeota archaeon]|nr:hypothetical protein [Thermoproteota archaeon]
MSESKGKIFENINRLPIVSFEASDKIFKILQEAAIEFPEISKFYVDSNSSVDRLGAGHFRYDQFVFAVQKWQKKWIGISKKI